MDDVAKDSGKQVKQYKKRKYNVRQKMNKDAPVKHLLMLPVHDIELVPFADKNDINSDVQKEIKVSDAMLQRIHKWSQHLFLHQWWTAKFIWELELLLPFLYNTIKEDNIDYPAWLTWLDRVSTEPDIDTYACRLLFLLMCSKRVKDESLSLLEFL